MSKTQGLDRSHHSSTAPKLVFAALHLFTVAVAGWMALTFDFTARVRALVLLGAAALYFVRHLVTLFVLLKRKVAWGESMGLAAFIAAFELGFVYLGGRSGSALGVWDALPVALVLVGSVLNTGSELQRMVWKKNPAHRGHLYTEGMFGWSQHINYFGDTVLFTGWALLTASPWALLVPLMMTLGFIFHHIPSLDAYLAERYGEAFEAYAARTPSLVPLASWGPRPWPGTRPRGRES